MLHMIASGKSKLGDIVIEVEKDNDIWIFLNDSHSSQAASVWSFFIMLVILVSCTAFILESLPQYQENNEGFVVLETICVVIFSVEYFARLIFCPIRKKLAFLVDFLNIIDFVAILPWYIDYAIKLTSTNENDDSNSGATFLRYNI